MVSKMTLQVPKLLKMMSRSFFFRACLDNVILPIFTQLGVDSSLTDTLLVLGHWNMVWTVALESLLSTPVTQVICVKRYRIIFGEIHERVS